MSEKEKIKVLKWPSQGPDFNPVEMLWLDPNRAVHKRMDKSLNELKQCCNEE